MVFHCISKKVMNTLVFQIQEYNEKEVASVGGSCINQDDKERCMKVGLRHQNAGKLLVSF